MKRACKETIRKSMNAPNRMTRSKGDIEIGHVVECSKLEEADFGLPKIFSIIFVLFIRENSSHRIGYFQFLQFDII